MKGKGKGISSSALPYKRRSPKWVTLTPSACSEIIVKLAKKGNLNMMIKNFFNKV
jgi:small subunit ribosomal protein S13e